MLHPMVAVLLLLLIILILCLPRKYVIAPFLVGVFCVPIGQVLVLGGVHFTVIRMLILAGLVRKSISGQGSPEGWSDGGVKPIDRLVTFWFGITLIASSVELMEMQALIKGLGDFLTPLEVTS